MADNKENYLWDLGIECMIESSIQAKWVLKLCAIVNKCHGWNTKVSKWVAK